MANDRQLLHVLVHHERSPRLTAPRRELRQLRVLPGREHAGAQQRHPSHGPDPVRVRDAQLLPGPVLPAPIPGLGVPVPGQSGEPLSGGEPGRTTGMRGPARGEPGLQGPRAEPMERDLSLSGRARPRLGLPVRPLRRRGRVPGRNARVPAGPRGLRESAGHVPVLLPLGPSARSREVHCESGARGAQIESPEGERDRQGNGRVARQESVPEGLSQVRRRSHDAHPQPPALPHLHATTVTVTVLTHCKEHFLYESLNRLKCVNNQNWFVLTQHLPMHN